MNNSDARHNGSCVQRGIVLGGLVVMIFGISEIGLAGEAFARPPRETSSVCATYRFAETFWHNRWQAHTTAGNAADAAYAKKQADYYAIKWAFRCI